MNLNKKQSRFFLDDSEEIQQNNKTSSNNEITSDLKIEEKKENNNFLFQLKKILENPKNYNIINWDLTGKYFIIKNVNEFTEKILPLYFRHKNYSSFVRQLNLYDFHKLKSENGSQVYKHRLFVRNKSYLIDSIKRKINNNNKKKLFKFNIKKNQKNNNYNNYNKIQENKEIFDNIYKQLNSNQKISKQSLENHLNILIQQTNSNNKKQDFLLKKFDELSNKNENFINQNQIILNDIIKKTHDNRKLETVILFILEVIMNKNKIIEKPIVLPKNNNNIIIPLPPKNENDNKNFNNNNLEKDYINNINNNSNIYKDLNIENSENNSYLNENFFNLTNDLLSEINFDNVSFENKSFFDIFSLDEKSLNIIKNIKK